MTSVKALINPNLLVWARQQAGYTANQLAEAVGVGAAIYSRWESGADKPTVPQAKRLAQTCRISFAVFYLPKPPDTEGRPVDFRTVLSGEGSLKPELLSEIRQARFRRDIMLEVVDKADYPDFGLTADLNEDYRQVAQRIRSYLGVALDDQRKVHKDRAFNFWRSQFEAKGILVFQMFKIDPQQARGLSLYFPELPIILTNVKDAVTGRVFTLFHELVHLMLRGDAICELVEDSQAPKGKQKIEAFCNRVAAEALVPQSDLEARLEKKKIKGEPEDRILRNLANHYKVSSLVICRRLLDLQCVSKSFYQAKQRQHDEEMEAQREKQRAALEARKEQGKGGGISPVQELFTRAGETYIRNVLSGYSDGRLSSSDVSEALGVRLKHLPKIEARL